MKRDELNRLCAEFKGPIKRPMAKQYRYTLPSGKLVTPKVERKVTYAPDAYRADKRRAGACPDYRGWDLMKVSRAATRDY